MKKKTDFEVLKWDVVLVYSSTQPCCTFLISSTLCLSECTDKSKYCNVSKRHRDKRRTKKSFSWRGKARVKEMVLGDNSYHSFLMYILLKAHGICKYQHMNCVSFCVCIFVCTVANRVACNFTSPKKKTEEKQEANEERKKKTTTWRFRF